jgi:hypothetical protein
MNEYHDIEWLACRPSSNEVIVGPAEHHNEIHNKKD